MAAARARESERPHRLFNDPLAAALAGAEGFAWLDRMTVAAGSGGPELYPVIRTRFFDEFLLNACGDAGVRQVVLVAAGLDTRAYRLEWPSGTRLYEVDLYDVLEAKEAVIKKAGAQPRCERHTIRADLRENTWPESLCTAGYQPRDLSVWLIEGLLFYLPYTAVHTLLAKVSAQTATGSLLGLDVMNMGLFFSPLAWSQQLALARQGAPGRFGTDNPRTLLADYGWDAEVLQTGEEEANFGRWPMPVMPWWLPGVPRSFLVRAGHT